MLHGACRWQARCSCGGVRRRLHYETYVCENETGEISCPDGLFIHLLVANYGRFSVQTCNKRGVNYPNTMCSNEKTMEKLMEM
uniref:Sushi domain-containing protein n=1 Tax=Plectus sambesii TaxID=2011161 RepID=A0A914UR48_9BILA